METCFDIPVCLIIFKRIDTTLKILSQISKIKPIKLYLLSDEGRTQEEKELVKHCRQEVENAIDWPCEVIKYYANENRGVYENIAGGARYVFSKEEKAIFLEDDNYPALSFFQYCKDMLDKFENNNDILWICGTNYLEKYECEYDVMYTKHLLPCGWASWSSKFLRFYDGDLKGLDEADYKKHLRKKYDSKKLFKQQLYCIEKEKFRKTNSLKYCSWDYQMCFSIRFYDKYGISPKYNQIENIGVDDVSEHGGNSWRKTMTRRFCGIPTHELSFPLKVSEDIQINKKYEKKVNNIITNDFLTRFKHGLKIVIFKVLGISIFLTFKEGLAQKKKQ